MATLTDLQTYKHNHTHTQAKARTHIHTDKCTRMHSNTQTENHGAHECLNWIIWSWRLKESTAQCTKVQSQRETQRDIDQTTPRTAMSPPINHETRAWKLKMMRLSTSSPLRLALCSDASIAFVDRTCCCDSQPLLISLSCKGLRFPRFFLQRGTFKGPTTWFKHVCINDE